MCLSQGALGSRELGPSSRSPTHARAVERVESTWTEQKPLPA